MNRLKNSNWQETHQLAIHQETIPTDVIRVGLEPATSSFKSDVLATWRRCLLSNISNKLYIKAETMYKT